MNKTCRYFFIVLLAVGLLPVPRGLCRKAPFAVVNGGLENPTIKWVSQYPAVKQVDKKQNFVKKIYNFLVQKDKQALLTRPVAILASNPTSFWVVDQAEETLFQVVKNKLGKPRSLRKKDNYFSSLVGACFLPGGDILFSDSRLNKLFIVNKDAKVIRTFGDTLTFRQPTGIAYAEATGEVWVVETAAHQVSVYKIDGTFVKSIGSRGEGDGQFNFPTSIWIDGKGDAYIVDAMNFRLQIFNKDGVFVTSFGAPGDVSGSFARPKGVAVDQYGNIYVADALFHVVQIFDRSGNFLYSFGKQGREKGEFWMPSGLYIDKDNFIYVADSYNSRVQVFQLINGS